MGKVTPEMVALLRTMRDEFDLRGLAGPTIGYQQALEALLSEWKERGERIAAWESAAQVGHPTPCTLGPLCPYCEIEGLRRSLAEARAEAKEYEDVIVRGQKALGDAGVFSGADGSLHPGIAALQDKLDEAREKLKRTEQELATTYNEGVEQLLELDVSREKMAKVVEALEISLPWLRRAAQCVQAPAVETSLWGEVARCEAALAAAKGGKG